MEISFRDIIEWSSTPAGVFVLRIFLVFLAAESARQFAYKIMVFTHLPKAKEDVIVDITGMVANVAAGVGLAVLLHGKSSILSAAWYCFGAFGIHMAYVRYIDRWLKNKARGKQ